MHIKIPTHFRGREVKGAMERVLERQTPQPQTQTASQQQLPLTVQANINPQDYIQIPDTNILIAKYEPNEFKGLNWEATHKALNEKGLFMPSPAILMPYFNQVIQANKGNRQLYDGSGGALPQTEINDIYRHLTEDHINGGAWAWLDARFENQNGLWKLHTNHRFVNNQLQGVTQDLEANVKEDCYVDLEFNSQGLATSKSSTQNYSQGENIYFYPPRNNAVARFDAFSVRAVLVCYRYPSFRYSSLGVRAVRHNASTESAS